MTTLKNDLMLRTLRGEKTERTPVWMMRQAGRYLPEYRATRAQAGSFLDLCKNAELACEVTLQPLERYPMDAAILFSDILTIPDAMGLGLYFEEGEGPRFERTVQTAADIDKLFVPDPNQELQYVMNAVSTIKKGLNGAVPLIGFSGSPWTLACYMVEGSGSKNFAKIKRMMYDTPELMHRLLDIVSQSVISYLQAQIEAGAQIVMVFDTWGGNLSTKDYETFSLAYSRKISHALQATNPSVPRILFTKGAGVWLETMADAGYSGLGVDWTTDLKLARELTKDSVVLQGNLDPTSLYASPEKIRQKVRDVLADYGHGHKHIFNLGHGILPDINPDHVKAMIDEVHQSSPEYHI
ncbi:uroporphyrinogen decarboxylase [Cycloclasticus sp.]|jgi:uroporphyrinogen decarboxylase|uniref:uroporphyrinogen decarboxylase n=1 Tax=Cycloclasticus TaxID=34067 RepID=UPI000C10BFEA|nr:uroporphyrinogen decarboxylase [Cycloclasticus sp.]PHR50254.1 MAG: uroporphyrinogen decarboxylase [Cycloclasticus sp.]